MLEQVPHPIVQAPMAGGVSTPALAAAVSDAGGLGFLAAGRLGPEQVRQQLLALRELTDRPFGVNLFVPTPQPGDAVAIAEYAALVSVVTGAEPSALGAPTFDDDDYDEKLAILRQDPPAVVSFAFGCPEAATIDALHAAGAQVWITVTRVEEAEQAARAGADAVIAQGGEAGGHRGGWVDDDLEPIPTLELVAAVRHAFDAGGVEGRSGDGDLGDGFSIVAAGGLMSGEHVAQAIGAGATAVQLGTAFMLCPEAGTSRPHRRLIAEDRPTALTRAFTGRRARGIVNAWLERAGDAAPSAYPEIAHLTNPLRTHGLSVGDADLMNLWAGERHVEARPLPAAQLVEELVNELASVGGA